MDDIDLRAEKEDDPGLNDSVKCMVLEKTNNMGLPYKDVITFMSRR